MRAVLVGIVVGLSIAAAVPAAAIAGAEASEHATGGSPSFDPAVVYKIPRGDAPAIGPRDAPVTIVTWSDYACGYCNRVQDTLDRLDRLYPGEIRWVHRTLPLDDDNTIASEAALAAAAQGRFAPMHARLFARHGRVDRADVELIARDLGLDMLRFRAELDAGTYRKALAADLDDARVLGITGTPTFFVNGRPVHGNQPLRVFAQVVGEELARAKQVAATHPADLYEALVGSGRPTADAPSDINNIPSELDPKTAYRVGLGMPGRQLGPDDALVTIVEWSDFQCPYCAHVAPLLAHVHDKFGNQVRIVYRDLPLAMHRDAMLAAEAGAAAAAQGKFWPFYDQVFQHAGHLARGDLETYAKAAGCDLVAFRAALDDRRYHAAVVAEASAGAVFGVDGTPTMFINAQPVVGAPRSAADLDRLVQASLDQAHAAIAKGLARGDIYSLVLSSATGDDLADPSTVPASTLVHVELRAEERGRAVLAACRRHDGARAAELAGKLAGDQKHRVAEACAGEGVDLP
jgi:protein-disulfide isomerase